MVRFRDNKSNSSHPIQTLKGFRDSVCRVQFKGSEVVCGSMDGSVRFYDIRNGQFTSDEFSEPIQSMGVSYSNKVYIASCTDNRIYLVEKSSGNRIQEYSGHNVGTFKIDCAFNIRDSHIVSGSVDGKLYVYEIMKK